MHVPSMRSQAIANIVCAYANAEVQAPLLFAGMAQAARKRLGEFQPLEMANMVWAFAVANHVCLLPTHQHHLPLTP